MRKREGITIVALVITIIVLIILAGVTYSIITSENGLIEKAKQAEYISNKNKYKEELKLALMDILIETKGEYIQKEELKIELEKRLGDKYNFSINIENENIIAKKSDKYIFEIDSLYNIIDDVKQIEETIAEFFIFNTETATITGINPEYLDGSTIKDEKYSNIVIPKKINDVEVTTIGNRAFYGITNLKSIVMQDGVTQIGSNAFVNCSNLTKVIIPETVNTITSASYVFSNCNNVSDVTIPIQYSIQSIFSASKESIEKVTLLKPEGQTKLADYSLSGLTKITQVTIPNGVTEIGQYTFNGCKLLTKVEIPETVEVIGQSAFWYCEALTTIKLPSNLNQISVNMLRDTGITQIEIPNGVTKIDTNAFVNCSNLTKVIIPETVNTMGTNVFYNCKNVSDVTIPIQYSIQSIFSNSKESIEKVTLLKPEGQTKLADYSLSGLTKITQVTIPNGVTEIGQSTFSGCKLLTKVEIPETVEVIGQSAFGYCEALTTIKLPSNLKQISADMFRSAGITQIEIPNGVTQIGSNAFVNCSNLTKVIIPGTVNTMGTNVFYNCTALTNIVYKGTTLPSGSPWGATNATITMQ